MTAAASVIGGQRARDVREVRRDRDSGGDRRGWPGPGCGRRRQCGCRCKQPRCSHRRESGQPAVARQVPADRLLVETDSPYLAPIPHRGKPNLPEYVRDVADYLAMLRGESYERFAEQTTANFKRLFPLAHVAG